MCHKSSPRNGKKTKKQKKERKKERKSAILVKKKFPDDSQLYNPFPFSLLKPRDTYLVAHITSPFSCLRYLELNVFTTE